MGLFINRLQAPSKLRPETATGELRGPLSSPPWRQPVAIEPLSKPPRGAEAEVNQGTRISTLVGQAARRYVGINCLDERFQTTDLNSSDLVEVDGVWSVEDAVRDLLGAWFERMPLLREDSVPKTGDIPRMRRLERLGVAVPVHANGPPVTSIAVKLAAIIGDSFGDTADVFRLTMRFQTANLRFVHPA